MRAIFDADYYMRANPDVAAAALDPLRHYLEVGWAEGRNPHPLFANDDYIDRNEDVATLGLNPLVHYVSVGARQGQRPHPLFDPQFYATLYPDVGDENPLVHYILQGAAELRQPNPLFDAAWYVSQYPEAAANPLAHYAEYGLSRRLRPHLLFDGAFYVERYPDVAAAEQNPLAHYLLRGHLETRDPHPLFDTGFYRRRRGEIGEKNPLQDYLDAGAAARVSPHPLFDAEWYVAHHPEAAANPLVHYLSNAGHTPVQPHPLFDAAYYVARYPQSHEAPLVHYVMRAHLEPLAPNPLFDPAWYARQCPDLGYANPLVHYLDVGRHAGRQPHPLFDPAYYLERHPDVASARQDPLEHYLLRGHLETRDPHPLFDTKWYREKYEDAANANPLVQYATEGAVALRQPNPLFDAAWYVKQYPEAADNPLAHYVEHGLTRRLQPHPLFDAVFYLESYPDVGDAGLNPLVHYLHTGWREHRNPNVNFDAKWYAATYAKSKDASPLLHHVLHNATVPTSPARSARRVGGHRPVEPAKSSVLVVAHSVPTDGRLFGAERSFLDMIRGLSAFDCNIHVLLPNDSKSYVDRLHDYCCGVWALPYPWWRAGHFVDRNAVENIQSLIKETRASLVYVNTIVLREPLLAARRERVLSAVHCRELITGDEHLAKLIGLSASDIVGEVRASADIIVANSQATAALFASSPNLLVAPNVVDVDAFEQVNSVGDANRVRVGIVSSNIAKKGIEDFAEIARLCSDNKNIEFHVVGPDTNVTRDLKARQMLGEFGPNLIFDGYIDSPVEAIGRIDVLLSLSHFAESFGRTIAEALAAARLVIAYDVGAISELIKPGVTGHLAQRGDHHAVAELVLDFANRRERSDHIRTQGKQFVRERHSESALQEAYVPLMGRIGVNRRNLEKELDLPATHIAQARNPEPLRIAYFCWHFPVPSETFVLNELRALHHAGHKLHVFCKQIPHPDFQPDFPIAFTRVRDADELAVHLQEFRADVIHGHFVYPTVTDMVWPAATVANIPFTFIAHAQDIFRYQNDAKNRVSEVAASPLCLKVLTLSRFHRQYLIDRGVPSDKIVINPNAIDPDLFSDKLGGPEKAGRSICAIGRFVEKKGFELLVQAAPALAALGVDIHIYGYGELEQRYRTLARESHVSNVHIHGLIRDRNELLEAFSRHDLCVCPSVRCADGDMDGIPTVLLEAMAAGLPVMATDISGISDIVVDGVSGFICDATASGICQAIEKFYALPLGFIESVKRSAARKVRQDHDVRRLVRNLIRIWRQERFGIVLVTWNNLPELREVVRRLLHFTTLPYEISICDNDSGPEVKAFLRTLEEQNSHIRVLFNSENAMVGPGTNLAMASTDAEYVIYVCGKEGFALNYNWERAFIYALDDNPEAALAGTLCYSPSYLKGRDFRSGNPRFADFRAKDFCEDNPDRDFRHIQGGLFIMRREIVLAAGGFSTLVPHNGTDVEVSVHLESRGLKLVQVDGAVSLYSKTRPSLEARLDETTRSAHPPTLHDLDWIDAVANKRRHICPLCGWRGRQFSGELAKYTCPKCGCDGDDRTLWRYLASETTFTYCRLPAIAVGLSGKMREVWQEQFQGPTHSVSDLISLLSFEKRLPNKTAALSLALMREPSSISRQDRIIVWQECHRLLAPHGKLLLLDEDFDEDELRCNGFSLEHRADYSSFACRFGWRSVFRFAPDQIMQ